MAYCLSIDIGASSGRHILGTYVGGKLECEEIHRFENGFKQKDGVLYARPIRSKSGLITTLANADGFFKIARDCEGLKRGSEIQVTICIGD